MLGLGSSAFTSDYVPINLADDISDMKRWYRPHEGVTFDAPTLKLEGWVDQTGNYNATSYQTNSGIEPLYQADGSFLINDATGTANGGSIQIASTAAPLECKIDGTGGGDVNYPGFSAFFVMKSSDFTSRQFNGFLGSIVTAHANVASGNYFRVENAVGSAHSGTVFALNDSGGSDLALSNSVTWGGDSKFLIIVNFRANGDFYMYSHTAELLNDTSNFTSKIAGQFQTLGSSQTYNGSAFTYHPYKDGRIYEFGAWERELTAAEIAIIQNDITNRHGL